MLIVAAGYVGYLYGTSESEEVAEETTEETAVEEEVAEETEEDYAYTNEDFGFSIEMPSSWLNMNVEEEDMRITFHASDYAGVFIIEMTDKESEAPMYTEYIGENDDYKFYYSPAATGGDGSRDAEEIEAELEFILESIELF